MTRPKMVLFDVYETLLDMRDMKRKVNQLLGSKRGYIFWFGLLNQYCFAGNCMNDFQNFSSIATATMKLAGEIFDSDITEYEINNVLEFLKHLPIHAGVEEGLSRLNDIDIRIAALTNSPENVVCDRMERTGLISYFEKVLSAEKVGKYKPAAEVYLWAANTFQLAPHEILFISAHDWDLMGAANVGMKTACVRNGSKILYTLAKKPDLVSRNLPELIEQLNK